MPKTHLKIIAIALTALVACTPLSPGISGISSKNYEVIKVTPQLISKLRKAPKIEGLPDEAKTKNTVFQYRIGPGDVLYAKIYSPSIQSFDGNAPKVTLSDNWQEYNEIVVTDDGNVTFPYVGDVQMAGKTLSEAKLALNTALGRYFKNPQSVLAVKEYYNSKIFVMGETVRQGMRNMKAGEMSVMEALTISQGPNPITADFEHIYVIRGALDNADEEFLELSQVDIKNPKPLNLGKNGELVLLNGIDETPPAKVQAKATPAPVIKLEASEPALGKPDLSTSAYIGGSKKAAKEFGTEVADSDFRTTVYEFDGSNGTGLAMAAQFRLEPNDVVYVSPLWITEWSRIITQVVPISAAYLANSSSN
jgi:polysaccharide export outer membrane protein